MQLCNLSGPVLLVLEKLRCQTIRKIYFRSLKPGKCPVDPTRTGHLPWRTGYNHRRVNVNIVVGNVTLEYAFVRVVFLYFLI
jgi:hypothetical protein